jgi:hypothetical protein
MPEMARPTIHAHPNLSIAGRRTSVLPYSIMSFSVVRTM